MKALITIALGLALVGCSAPAEAPKAGSESVYQRIESLSDCELLQQEFNTAESHSNIEYMEAADKRMQEVGCY